MFLHLREKTKFIRYSRYNRYTPNANAKPSRRSYVRRSKTLAYFLYAVYFR